MKGLNESEFDKVFKSYYNPIRNFIYYKSGDSQAAEDIAQDTFLKVWEKRDDIKVETVKALLYRIASNLYLNRVEHVNVTMKFATNYQQSGMSESADFELEMKEFDDRLQRALSALDEKNRTVFLMNRIDGFTYAQIAEILDLSVKAVEKRMEKALASLREKINMKF
jgi:RNA polymerase sigma-70 factor (family 1)